MDTLLKTFDQLVMGNSISLWLQALAIAVVSFLVLVLARRVIRRNYQLTAQTERWNSWSCHSTLSAAHHCVRNLQQFVVGFTTAIARSIRSAARR